MMQVSSAAPGIAAIVVTYRSAETIALCIERLRSADGVTSIRVIDNGSDDGTVQIVQRLASIEPRLRFIANPENPGFAVGCNQGARECTDATLAFVNPDCLVDPDTLSRLASWSTRLDGALVGAELRDEDGAADPASRRRDPDFSAMVAGLLTGGSTALAVANNGEAIQSVDAISGALMVMPRRLFEQVGGFDEGYRLHAEDLDLCRRVRDAGATVAVANAVQVVHLRGVSSRSRPVFVEWHKHRGLWRYFMRFEAPRRSGPMRAAVALAISAHFVVSAVRAVLRDR